MSSNLVEFYNIKHLTTAKTKKLLDLLEIFRLDMVHRSPLYSKRSLLHFCSGMRRTIKSLSFGRESDLRLSAFVLFFNFCFRLSFFFFCHLLAAVIDLLLGLLPVPKIMRKHDHRDGTFLQWNSRV